MTMTMRRRWLGPALLSMALLAVGACKKDETKPGAGKAEGAKPAAKPGSGTPAPTGETPLIATAEVARYLPANTALLAVVDGVAPMLKRLGFDAAREKHKALIDPVGAKSKTFYGHDLTRLDAWAGIGLDLDGPAGLALWLEDAPTLGLFCTLGDAAKFEAFVQSTVKRHGKFNKVEADGATIYELGGRDMAFVVRGKVAMLVSSAQKGKETARAVAGRDEAKSLAKLQRMQDAAKAFGYGTQGSAWVDVTELGAFAAAADRPQDTAPAQARNMVAKPIAMVLGDAPAAIFGGALETSAITLRGQLLLDKKSPFRPLFGKPAKHAALAAISRTPLTAVSAHLDPKAVYRALKKGAQSMGSTDALDAVTTALTPLGLDLTRLDTIFTGEVGVAITGDLPKPSEIKSEQEVIAKLGGALAVGLAKDSPIKDAIQRALTMMPDDAKKMISGDNGKWTVTAPGMPKVYVTVTDAYLIVSTDEAAAGRAGNGPGFADAVKTASHKAIFTTESSLVASVDFGPIGYTLMAQSDYGERPLPEPTEETKEDHATLKAKRAELKAIRDARNAAQMAIHDQLVDSLGALSGEARSSAVGYDGSAGLFFRVPVAEYFDRLLGFAAKEGERDAEAKKLRVLTNDVWELEQKLTTPQADEPARAVPPPTDTEKVAEPAAEEKAEEPAEEKAEETDEAGGDEADSEEENEKAGEEETEPAE